VEGAVGAGKAHLDHQDPPDNQESPVEMDSQEDPDSPAQTLNLQLNPNHKDKDARPVSQLQTAHPDHPAQPEDQDRQVPQEKMRMAVDEDLPDLPVHPAPPEIPVVQAKPVDQELLDPSRMCPAERAHPDPLALMESPADPAALERMESPVDLEILAHQETTEGPADQEILAAQDPKENREVKEAKAPATTAHPHAPLPDINWRPYEKEESSDDSFRIPKSPPNPLPQISIDTLHALTSSLLLLLSIVSLRP